MSGLVSPVEPSVGRAMRLSYAQAMLTAIYAASTGGMFLIGYALRLGANNVEIGLLSTIPMLCVVMQLGASALVERGVSRRSLTLVAALANVSCWALAILIPSLGANAGATVKVFALIAAIALVALFAQISGNARASWVGDLIPATLRGTFFGRLTMYGGIVGTVFALLEGAFLDRVKHAGIGAFGWLFGFGMVFGVVSALLFVPQPDTPLARHESPPGFLRLVGRTFTNRPLMIVIGYTVLWSMQAIAGPFYATYMLRDLKMPFLGVGAINAVATLTMLAASPFWGRVVDRHGCRPVIIACTAAIAPSALIWVWMTSARMVYLVVPAFHVLAGVGAAGISVALSTLTYKVTPSAGRSTQLAMYSIVVVLAVSPMPALGGYLPDWLGSLGIGLGLRVTFLAAGAFILISAWVARFIREPDSGRTRAMVGDLFARFRKPGLPRTAP